MKLKIVLQAENSVRKSLDFGFNSGPASESGDFKHQFLGDLTSI